MGVGDDHDRVFVDDVLDVVTESRDASCADGRGPRVAAMKTPGVRRFDDGRDRRFNRIDEAVAPALALVFEEVRGLAELLAGILVLTPAIDHLRWAASSVRICSRLSAPSTTVAVPLTTSATRRSSTSSQAASISARSLSVSCSTLRRSIRAASSRSSGVSAYPASM